MKNRGIHEEVTEKAEVDQRRKSDEIQISCNVHDTAMQQTGSARREYLQHFQRHTRSINTNNTLSVFITHFMTGHASTWSVEHEARRTLMWQDPTSANLHGTDPAQY